MIVLGIYIHYISVLINFETLDVFFQSQEQNRNVQYYCQSTIQHFTEGPSQCNRTTTKKN